MTTDVKVGDWVVRPRRDGDLPPLVELLERTHVEQRYPVRRSNVRAGWLADPDELHAWVAASETEVLGHVALHPAHGPSAPLWRTATGRDDDHLAVVSRLVSSGRVPGIGSALLDRAAQHAASLDRALVLEVDLRSAAHGFYLRRGWRQVGEVDQQWGEVPVRVGVLVLGSGADGDGTG